jgi:hypothetical protein
LFPLLVEFNCVPPIRLYVLTLSNEVTTGKVTSPDDELKIIVFSPFVLHYSINEVLRLLAS